MSISLYDVSVPVFIRSLTNLARLLRKADYQASLKGYPAALLLQSRLYPDMYELSRQVIRATEIATDGVSALAGLTNTPINEPIVSMEQHIARVNQAISFLVSVPPRQLSNDLDRSYLIPPRNEEQYSALGYILFYLLPNFHFHITTAYNILRHNGVDIGKQDYLGTTKPEDHDWPDLGAFI